MNSDSNAVTEELMNNPELLASLQDQANFKLDAMKKYEKLPLYIKKRVKALKNFQLEQIKIEESFFRELSKLEAKFSEQYQFVHDKRKEIVEGLREPTEIECSFEETDEIEALADDVNNKATLLSGDEVENSTQNDHDTSKPITENEITPDGNITESSVQGIPDFWLTVLQNAELIKDNIQEHDIPVLKHLIDIKCIVRVGEDTGFVLEFYFSPNEYFTDQKLTKEYFVKVNVSSKYPLSYEGPEIYKTKGCHIHWNPGKNKTIKLVKKIQKRAKKDSDKRTITKVVKNDSFFNFFDPPTESLEDEDADISEDIENILESDFEIGQFIRERIIPRAVLYYTGEAIDDEFDLEDEDDEEDSDEDDSDNNRENGDVQVIDQKPDCKQQ